MSKRDESLELLSAYVDEDLRGPRRARLEEALRQSPELRAELQALRELKGAAREPQTFEAPMHLWPAVRSAVQSAPPRPIFPRHWAWSAVPVGAAMVLLVWGWWLRPPPEPTLDQQLASARATYVAAIGRLTEASSEAVEALNPETRTQLVHGLEVVERAIRDAEQALSDAPEDPFAHEVLLSLYEEKVRILSLTLETSAKGGDAS